MTRKQAIAYIRANVAEEGVVSRHTVRIYCENRISRETFNRACAEGLEVYKRLHPEKDVYVDSNTLT